MKRMADNPNSIVDDATMKKIGEIIKSKAKGLSPSSRIDAALVVEMIPPTKTGQTGVKLTVRGVPFARAMEYGSGTHNVRKFQSKRQTSPTSTIEITPKNGKKFLVFDWDKAEGYGMKNPVHLTRVDHPGIKAANEGKGYMHPALEASRQEISALIGENAMDNLRLKIRAVFSRPGGINK